MSTGWQIKNLRQGYTYVIEQMKNTITYTDNSRTSKQEYTVQITLQNCNKKALLRVKIWKINIIINIASDPEWPVSRRSRKVFAPKKLQQNLKP